MTENTRGFRATTLAEISNLYVGEKDAAWEAMRELGPRIAFALYMWLFINEDVAMSRNVFINELGISPRAYFKAKKKLRRKGYIVPKPDSNEYIFCERPQR